MGKPSNRIICAIINVNKIKPLGIEVAVQITKIPGIKNITKKYRKVRLSDFGSRIKELCNKKNILINKITMYPNSFIGVNQDGSVLLKPPPKKIP